MVYKRYRTRQTGNQKRKRRYSGTRGQLTVPRSLPPRFRKQEANVVHWKKTFLYQSQALTADLILGFQHKLTDLYVEENAIGPLFRFYKLKAVKVRFLYTINQGTNASALGWLYFLRNQSVTVTTAPGGSAGNFLNCNCAIRRLDGLDGSTNYSTFYYKVKPVEINFDGVVNTQYMPPGGPGDWISTSDPGMQVIHRGADIFAHGGTGSTGYLDIWMTYYFSTKDHK